MSIIEQAAVKAGIHLERDVPVRGERTCKHIAKLIGSARQVEAEVYRILESERQKRADLESKHLAVVEENYRLKRENEQLRLRERMREMELPRKDQTYLLEGPPKKESEEVAA